MTVEMLQLLSLIAYIVAGVLFLLSVALFFVLDVPKLYGDVSGRTAKKAIAAIRQQNEAGGDKAYRPSPAPSRVRVTDKITKSGRLDRKHSGGLPINVGTEKIGTYMPPPQAAETSVLDNETSVLMETASETSVLMEPANETSVLTEPVAQAPVEPAPVMEAASVQTADVAPGPAFTGFTVDVEMSFTDSTEIIE